MNEDLIVAAILDDRETSNLADRIGLDSGDFGEASRALIDAAREQYARDRNLQSTDRSVLRSQVVRRFGEGDTARSVLDYLGGLPAETSGVNVVEEYRLLKVRQAGNTLATLLATGQHGPATQEQLERYRRLVAGEDAAAGEEAGRLRPEDYEGQSGERIMLAPGCLSTFIGGGVLRGHNITVYGRPDSGKSMFGLNQAACSCKAGYTVLYVANEEPDRDITRRVLARMAGAPVSALTTPKAIRRAIERAGDAYDRWFLFHKAGVTLRDIQRQAEAVKPDIIVVDQLKNVVAKDDNRALQLDTLARGVRELGIRNNAVTISITQAGESAQGKLVLGMSDIEWSNTGIPGAADLMVGIGVDMEYDNTGRRMISIPKNKVNGRRGSLTVFVEPQRTAFLSKPRA